MRIAVDAMGGDWAPFEIVEGAVEVARQDKDIDIVLVGNKEQLVGILSELNVSLSNVAVFHASQVVGMGESATMAARSKKDSSIARSIELAANGEVDAVVSAGNTGAMVVASSVLLKTLEGVRRPGISILMPRMYGSCVIVDVGANLNCKPEHLLQYGIMASVFCKYILEIENPRIGLLNVGVEDVKGNSLVKGAFDLLSKTSLNFIGNVESCDIFDQNLDVVICDGFVGNVILKFSEGISYDIFTSFEQESRKDEDTNHGFKLCKPAIESIRNRNDYAEYGGAPLLGINGICVIAHGRSKHGAIINAIKEAIKFSVNNVNKHIVADLKRYAGAALLNNPEMARGFTV